MSIKTGDKVPECTLKTMGGEGPVDITTGDIFAGKKVLPDGWKLFGYFRRELENLVALIPANAEQEKLAS